MYRPKILNLLDSHIKKYKLETTTEKMFIQFNEYIQIHSNFLTHLKETGDIYKLNAMKRNERLKERRKMFAEWYCKTNQDKKNMKTITIELSELTFVSTRTIEKDIYGR